MTNIKKGKIKDKLQSYEKPSLPVKTVTFSFQFLDHEHPDLNLSASAIEISYIQELLSRFKNISTMSITEFRGDSNRGNVKSLRCHKINWEDTFYKDGFAHLSKQYQEYEPRQFSISQGHGRVHGFFKDEAFCVVWFDPHHKVYPNRNK